MKKIAVVGVEGSGKTVMLTAIGVKYEKPDVSGVFISPENQRAFGFVSMHANALHEGRWPAATISNSNLDWSLYCKKGDSKEMICSLSLLDFAGELFRLSFGEHSEEELAGDAEEIEVLRKHIDDSDVLLVIVNLSDVINGSPLNPRTRETMWLTKSVIDYATRSGSSKDVAIVFSQADLYRSIIEECGGNIATLRKYMPHVASLYDKLPIFAVSAINKTVPSEKGFPVPAPDFVSEGVDELMEWIISKTPGYESLAATMREKRLAPIALLRTAKELQHSYVSECCGNTPRRLDTARKLVSVLENLRQANQQSPQYAQAAAELDNMEQEAQEWLDIESKAIEIINSVSVGNISLAESRLTYWLQNSEHFALRENELRQEIAARQRELQRERRKRLRRKGCITLFSVFAVVASVVVGYSWYLQEYVEQKKDDGYVIRQEYGIPYAVWKSGHSHPKYEGLTSTTVERQWSIQPPYRWAHADYSDRGCRMYFLETVWTEGIPHPDNKNIISSSNEGSWLPADGYEWREDKHFTVKWVPTKKHPKHKGVVAGVEEGTWELQVPYRWKDADYAERSCRKQSLETVWTEGIQHLSNKNILSSSTEGQWQPAAGYDWSEEKDFTVKWVPAVKHPQNDDLVSSEWEQEWHCSKAGYVWAGGARTEWKPGLQHPRNGKLTSADKADTWVASPGYTWEGGDKTVWKSGMESDKYPHWITTAREGEWKPKDGYKKVSYGAPMLSALVWNRSWNNDSKRATVREGVFEYKHTCSECKGEKKVGRTKYCKVCHGDGEEEYEERCGECRGKGRIYSSSQCYRCEGAGKIRNFAQCSNCGGNPVRMCINPLAFVANGMHCQPCTGCAGMPFYVCYVCQGHRRIPCTVCGGAGGWKCDNCTNGQVELPSTRCTACDGAGRPSSPCYTCSETGKRRRIRTCSNSECHNGNISYRVKCDTCKGVGYVWK